MQRGAAAVLRLLVEHSRLREFRISMDDRERVFVRVCVFILSLDEFDRLPWRSSRPGICSVRYLQHMNRISQVCLALVSALLKLEHCVP